MDDRTRKHDAGFENEKAFTETLTSDHGLDPDTLQEISKEVEQAKAKESAEKTRTKQPPWVGKIMGHFKLLRQIGEGAMGLVIQAEDTQLKRIVALKVLRKKLSTGEKGKAAIEQFLREARAAASIEHPNIVRVYEINQHAGWWYIAMEMVEGNSLQEIVKAAGPLPASRGCPIIADAATALNVAHEMGMIHRDIKPSNILVTRNGRGKISDFGLVRIEDPGDPFDIYAHQSIGTPFYMAPEMIQRKTTTPAMDIYSLGATLYYTLTGHPPYLAEEMKDVLRQHLDSDPPDLQLYMPGSSPNLAMLIKRMMAKQPDIRPKASEVAAILNAESISFFADSQRSGVHDASTISLELQALQQRTRTMIPSQTQVMGPKRSRFTAKWWLMITAAVVVLAIAGVLFQVITSRASKQDRRTVEKLFPQAPSSYGTRNAGVIPPASKLTDVPAFSWKGKVDTAGFHYVASKSGRHYYSITDKRALLIRAEDFVGYKTVQEAVRDRKQPAP